MDFHILVWLVEVHVYKFYFGLVYNLETFSMVIRKIDTDGI